MNQALRAVATGQAEKPQPGILALLENPKVAKGMAAVAGKYLAPDKMLRLCINAVHKTPDLLKCNPKSVLGAMMASAALDLEPNTPQQQAFLIPYKRSMKVDGQWIETYDCQFQIGARGFRTLAYRSPRIKLLEAEAIHERDIWKHRLGSQAMLEYEKALANRGELIGAFSYARLEGGFESAVVLPLEEILKIRNRSETWRALARRVETAENERDRAKADAKLAETPWVMWIDDMAAKSATKKHAKQLPLDASPALAVAANLDDAGDAGGLDLSALSDPDLVREVAAGAEDLPQLADETAQQAERSTEAFGSTQRQREAVAATPAAAKTGAKRGAAKEPPAPPAATEASPASRSPVGGPDSAAAAASAAPSYAAIAAAISKAGSRDDALAELDASRDLPADQQRDLKAHLERTWPVEG